jgi:hypothetical protein
LFIPIMGVYGVVAGNDPCLGDFLPPAVLRHSGSLGA